MVEVIDLADDDRSHSSMHVLNSQSMVTLKSGVCALNKYTWNDQLSFGISTIGQVDTWKL